MNFDGVEESYVTFGSPNDSCRSGELYSLDLDSKNDDWWTVRMRGLRYGGESIQKSPTDYAIIDSGTSFIHISKTDWE